ncbi:Wadjet anti-phage system protein JetD domain-containing protein [Acetobacterium malicum]|uniref:Wadjet anti-phage system protein JetD domain-containing protein n=1 Tax=Acetobacterium malicum TaxID=52692 RepID=UPI000407600C|nr:Wadjet anti-phage system protein JetD domain-containing protein [Acetobacterium dehalogenans]
MNKWDEKILTILVDKYRHSKKDSNTNKVTKRTQVKPEMLYKKYYANDGDYDIISAINDEVENLAQLGFLTYEREKFGTSIISIYLVDDQIDPVEDYLHKEFSFIPKRVKKDVLLATIEQYRNASDICRQECDRLQKQLTETNKIPANYELIPKILDAVAFIENNQTDLYVREVSMKVYGDSKYFEENTLKPACLMIRKYKNMPCESDQQIDEILVNYAIIKEPLKFSIKGNCRLIINGKELDLSLLPEGIELNTDSFNRIEKICIDAPKFMTIENRTSYLRYSADDTVIFFLGGYANRHQRDFIKKVDADNPDLQFLHFGDIDAGGFWIHHNLCGVTGVDFKIFCMSQFELSQPQYSSCLQKLTKTDVVRLQELKNMILYADTIQYMLHQNVKLEQEIISLDLMQSASLKD